MKIERDIDEELRRLIARARWIDAAELLWLIVMGTIIILAVLFWPTSADAATITVSPGQSIQSAINGAAVGDTVLVKTGIYSGSGLNISKTISLVGEPGTVLRAGITGSGTGIQLRADGILVNGFRIENFQVAFGPADLAARANIQILNNHTYQSQYHCWINGTNWRVEGNRFERVRWWSGTGDADYCRMFGTGHVFRGNYLYGTNLSSTDLAPLTGSDYAHVDGIQYYGNNGAVLQDCVIDKNYFADFLQGLFLCDEFSGSLARITITNNTFWGRSFVPPSGSTNYYGRPSWGIVIGKNVGGKDINVQFNTVYNCNILLGIRAASTGFWVDNILSTGGTVYDPSSSTPKQVTIGNLIHNFGTIGQTGYIGVDTLVDTLSFVDTTNPLGADGLYLTADDGVLATGAAALGFGPVYEVTQEPAPGEVTQEEFEEALTRILEIETRLADVEKAQLTETQIKILINSAWVGVP